MSSEHINNSPEIVNHTKIEKKVSKVNINNLLNRVREEEKKTRKENLVFFGLISSVIFISGILLSL